MNPGFQLMMLDSNLDVAITVCFAIPFQLAGIVHSQSRNYSPFLPSGSRQLIFEGKRIDKGHPKNQDRAATCSVHRLKSHASRWVKLGRPLFMKGFSIVRQLSSVSSSPADLQCCQAAARCCSLKFWRRKQACVKSVSHPRRTKVRICQNLH